MHWRGRAERISSKTHHTTHISLNLQSAEVGDEDDALLYSASEAGRFRCGNAHTTHHSEAMKGKRGTMQHQVEWMDAAVQGGGNEGGDDDDDALHRWGG